MSTTLVLGGLGFIGHHLVTALAAEGHSVVVVDDGSRGTAAHREACLAAGDVRCIDGDVAAPGVLDRIVTATRPSLVYHLAAIHFIPQCVAAPTETVRVNVLGTQCLLDALARVPDARLVFASTADVYGTSRAPHAEEDAIAPANVYGASKWMGEQLLALARRVRPNGTRLLAARFFNVYGPGETNPHVLPDMLACLRRGGTLRLGNLDPVRDYVHVSDVVAALVRLATYDGPEDVFNVGTGIGTTVRGLVDALASAVGRSIDVEQDPHKVRPVERMALVANVARARRALGWTARVSLAEGIEDLVRHELEAAPRTVLRAVAGAR